MSTGIRTTHPEFASPPAAEPVSCPSHLASFFHPPMPEPSPGIRFRLTAPYATFHRSITWRISPSQPSLRCRRPKWVRSCISRDHVAFRPRRARCRAAVQPSPANAGIWLCSVTFPIMLLHQPFPPDPTPQTRALRSLRIFASPYAMSARPHPALPLRRIRPRHRATPDARLVSQALFVYSEFTPRDKETVCVS